MLTLTLPHCDHRYYLNAYIQNPANIQFSWNGSGWHEITDRNQRLFVPGALSGTIRTLNRNTVFQGLFQVCAVLSLAICFPCLPFALNFAEIRAKVLQLWNPFATPTLCGSEHVVMIITPFQESVCIRALHQ